MGRSVVIFFLLLKLLVEFALCNTPASISAPTITTLVPQTNTISGSSLVSAFNNTTGASHSPLIGHYTIFIPLCWTDRRFVWRWGCDRDCYSFLSVITSLPILSELSSVLRSSLAAPLIKSNFKQHYCCTSGVHHWPGISCKVRRFQCHCWYNFWWWCIISGVVLKHLPAIRALLEITTTITLLDTLELYLNRLFFWLKNHAHQYLSW